MPPHQHTRYEQEPYPAVEQILREYRYRPDALIEVLHRVQEQCGHLSRELLGHVAHRLQLPPSLVYGVASFYHEFRLEPRGRHHCTVCTGTSCHIKGGSALLAELERRFALPCGSTTPDGAVSLTSVRCLGICGQAPLALVDGELLSAATPEELADNVTARLAASGIKGKRHDPR